jgi:hypothetical protein
MVAVPLALVALPCVVGAAVERVFDQGLGGQYRCELFDPQPEVFLRSGDGVVAVGKAAIGIVSVWSGNPHSVFGMCKIREIAGI